MLFRTRKYQACRTGSERSGSPPAPRTGGPTPMLRIAWLGFHQEGLLALEDLLENGPRPVCVITLAAELRSERSGAVDLGPLCARHGTPLVEIRDVNDAETQTLLDRLDLDLLVVIG